MQEKYCLVLYKVSSFAKIGIAKTLYDSFRGRNMEVDKKRFGERVRDWRIKNGLTQDELGKLFEDEELNENKANKAVVSAWERGDSIPSPYRLKKLSDLIGISVEELLYGSIKEYLYSFFASPNEEAPPPNQLENFYELYVNRFGHTYQNEDTILDFLEYATGNIEIEGKGIQKRKAIAVSTYINIILLTYLTDNFLKSVEDKNYNRALKASLQTSKFNFNLLIEPFKLNKSSKENIKVRTKEIFDDMNKKYNNKLNFNDDLFDSFFEV